MKEYSCFLISNKPWLLEEIQKEASPEEIKLFDGSGYPSFSKLVNTCVSKSPTEIVILMSDKVRPTAAQISKTVSLINEGYGLVALYRFGFFGFKKELFRKVGMLDERYVGGGYEDDDYYIRLKESNVSMYVTEEVEYRKSVSSWNYDLSRPHFWNKWVNTNHPEWHPQAKRSASFITRKIPEEDYSQVYDLGNSTGDSFLDFSRSVIQPTKARGYLQIKGKK
jgi:GT2 family glycosyltransferase